MPGIIVKPRSRIFHGHEWVYGTEIKKQFGNPEPGDVVSIKDFKDRPLGSGIFNPKSQIAVRRFSRRKQDLDEDFFERRIGRAWNYRRSLPIDTRFCRVVWSESDGLPGVIIDRYEDHFVLQTLTLAMHQRIELISRATEKLFSPKSVIERNDSPLLVAEGIEPGSRTLAGERPERFTIETAGIPLTVDLAQGHKTGLYLDQLENYEAVAALGKDREKVLDCFCNQGGFALACKRAGATTVHGIDVGEPVIEQAKANAERAGLEVTFEATNAFHFLKKAQKEGRTYDLIVLDPPSFTRNKKSLNDALRGYKEIHLRALKMLEPGGHLATFSCSHHLSHTGFLDMVRSASVDAKRTLREVHRFSQRPDHPIIPTIPETEYLRGFAFEVMPAW
ncbi:MAG: class I SAM-dependent rRNA methyltransferase [Verrucomicrobiota bacterium]